MGPVSNLRGGHDPGGDPRDHHRIATDGRGADNPIPSPIDGSLSIQIRPAERRELHAALQMILGVNGRPAAEEHVVDFLRFAVHRGINLKDTWVAASGGALSWAVLPVISPGRTMLLFAPSFIPPQLEQACIVPLVQPALESCQSKQVDLAQILLDPADEHVTRMYCEGCGFEILADLIYLEREVPRATTIPPTEDYTWETYSAANHDAFARAVAATYIESLDCPRLNGCRSVEDVLAGHKAAGEFDPALWMLARAKSPAHVEPDEAGVILMTRTTRSDALELVYLGAAPAHRGRKLSDAMMRCAFASVASIGSRRLSLAVDSKNEPALKLYRRHGMSKLCSRLALLRDLRAGTKGRKISVA